MTAGVVARQAAVQLEVVMLALAVLHCAFRQPGVRRQEVPAGHWPAGPLSRQGLYCAGRGGVQVSRLLHARLDPEWSACHVPSLAARARPALNAAGGVPAALSLPHPPWS